MTFKKWCWVSRILGLAGIALVVLGVVTSGGELSFRSVWVCLGLALLVAMAVVAAITLKCPKCYLKVPEALTHNVKTCPYCKTKLYY